MQVTLLRDNIYSTCGLLTWNHLLTLSTALQCEFGSGESGVHQIRGECKTAHLRDHFLPAARILCGMSPSIQPSASPEIWSITVFDRHSGQFPIFLKQAQRWHLSPHQLSSGDHLRDSFQSRQFGRQRVEIVQTRESKSTTSNGDRKVGDGIGWGEILTNEGQSREE